MHESVFNNLGKMHITCTHMYVPALHNHVYFLKKRRYREGLKVEERRRRGGRRGEKRREVKEKKRKENEKRREGEG